MKYINQLEYPDLLYVTRTTMDGKDLEFGKTSTVKTSGCGLCAALIAADRLLVNYEFTLTDAIQLSYDTKANERVGTDYKRFAPAFAEKLGLRFEYSNNLEDVRNCLRTGGAVVVLADGNREGHVGLFTKTGHYITIVSEEPDGRFAILDPSFTPSKYEEEGRKGRVEIKYDMIILCDGETLAGECLRENPYSLFWRK